MPPIIVIQISLSLRAIFYRKIVVVIRLPWGEFVGGFVVGERTWKCQNFAQPVKVFLKFKTKQS